MFDFYKVNEKYAQYLKTIDSQIPDLRYDRHDKFVCGIVLKIGDINYYAPVSHFNKPQKTNFAIRNNRNQVISTIRFCFMFPAIEDVLERLNFKEIAKTDSSYADLLKTEYEYCKLHYDEIMKRALSVYKIGCNKNHFLNYTCCDFKKLEEEYLKFEIIEEVAVTSEVEVR